jgi:hypothetical protein
MNKKDKPLRSLRLCGEKKDLHITGSAHTDEIYISTPTYPPNNAWTFSLAEGLRNKIIGYHRII